MGFGSNEARRKMYYCGIKAGRKDGNTIIVDPHITVQTREKDDGPIVDKKPEKAVSGYVLKLTDGHYEFEGRKIQKIGIHLVDGNDEYKLELNLNNAMARSLINKMATIEKFGWLTVRVFLQKAKKAGDRDNAGMWLGHNNESVNWKYQYKRTPETAADTIVLEDMVTEQDDPQDPSKKMKVYHKLNAFLLEDWKRLYPMVQSSAKELGIDAGFAPPPPTAPQKPNQPAPQAAAAPAPGAALNPGAFRPGEDDPLPDGKPAPTPGTPGDEPSGPGHDPTDDLPF